MTSALRTLLYAWCTAARFAHPLGCCLFFRVEGFGISVLPEDAGMHEWLFRELGCHGVRVYRAAIVMDVALHAFDSLRHGSKGSATDSLDARLQEASRRH